MLGLWDGKINYTWEELRGLLRIAHFINSKYKTTSIMIWLLGKKKSWGPTANSCHTTEGKKPFQNIHNHYVIMGVNKQLLPRSRAVKHLITECMGVLKECGTICTERKFF